LVFKIDPLIFIRKKDTFEIEIVWSIYSELRETGIGLRNGGFGYGCLQASTTFLIPADVTFHRLLTVVPT
jgi:hypothetical protein